MSKFLVTKTLPKDLRENDFVIGDPNFYSEIIQCKGRKPKSAQMTVNYLREVIAAVGRRYVGDEFDALTDINVSKFIGIPCSTDLEVHNALLKVFQEQCPKVILAYVHDCFKQRPSGTNFIFYTGNSRFCTKLVELGWEQVSEKEFKDSRSGLPKKIIGKPAITAESAASLNNENV